MANLNQDQTAASRRFFDFLLDPNTAEFVIQGSAGTGKTHLVRHIIDNIPRQQQAFKTLGLKPFEFKECWITATTRKAAFVISEVLDCEPRTIHSLLGLTVYNNRTTGETELKLSRGADIIRNSLIFIDEASFIDDYLLHAIRQRTYNCKIVYIGDPYQLTPASAANCPVFNGLLPTVHLNQIMRHQGAIEQLAGSYKEAVRTRRFPALCADQDKVKHLAADEYKTLINDVYTDPAFDANQVRILAWTNERVHQYNTLIRNLKGYTGFLTAGELVQTNRPIMSPKKQVLLPTDGTARVTNVSKPEVRRGCDGHWVTLEHVIEIFVPSNPIQVKNKLKEYRKAKNWNAFYDIQEYWGDLRPPYACTVHKSQGSTYHTVFIDLADIARCNVPSDVARMLYVAISRASHRVVLNGELPQKYGGLYEQLSA